MSIFSWKSENPNDRGTRSCEIEHEHLCKLQNLHPVTHACASMNRHTAAFGCAAPATRVQSLRQCQITTILAQSRCFRAYKPCTTAFAAHMLSHIPRSISLTQLVASSHLSAHTAGGPAALQKHRQARRGSVQCAVNISHESPTDGRHRQCLTDGVMSMMTSGGAAVDFCTS